MSFKEFLISIWQTRNGRIILAALFMFFSSSMIFLSKLLDIYLQQPGGIFFITSVVGVTALSTVLFFLLISHGRLTRWILGFFTIISAQATYFMAQYGTVIDAQMVDNLIQTSTSEIWGLITPAFIVHTSLFGIFPAWLIFSRDVKVKSLCHELKVRLVSIAACLVLIVLLIAPFASSYATFIRVHKEVRLYVNPLSYIYATARYTKDHLLPRHVLPHLVLATDVHKLGQHHLNELIILVIGETARSDRFSLNGYHRNTNPELRNHDVISFTQVSSCGTSTAVSVPCMFSVLGHEKYDAEEAKRQDNALDVLTRGGVKVLWRDNNSDSKGVADRITYENFSSSERNPVCDPECRDIGMLDGLDKFLLKNQGHDVLIVLHQMGSHGPEYYKRYPAAFEIFKPVCRSGELQTCSRAEIDNAYDNTIRYTDHFLSSTIDFLKKHDANYETAMIYVSDHGESLGENGIYLHGAPYKFAPNQQTHVPAIIWVGENAKYSTDRLLPYRDLPISHDDLFCGLLMAFDRETKLCKMNRPDLRAVPTVASKG